MDAHPVRLDLVMAYWCGHCHPLSIEQSKLLGESLGVPVRILDIDRSAEEAVADDLVRRYGDWSPDYLIPQVFLEWSDGRVQHLLTGNPAGISGTRAAWERARAALGRPG